MSMIDAWLDRLPSGATPSVEMLWADARRSLDRGDLARARRVEALIYVLHNSVVPAACGIRASTRFAYGGIGLVLHKDTELGEHVMIGQGVTIGGNPGRFRLDDGGRRRYTPRIGNHVYIAAGARILGGIEIGDGVIVGANAVVTRSVPPLSVVTGSPATVVRRIVPANCLRSKAHFIAAKAMTNDTFVAFIADLHARLVAAEESNASAAEDDPSQPEALIAAAGPLLPLPAGELADSEGRSLYRRRLRDLEGSPLADQGAMIVDGGQWAAPGFEPVALSTGIDWESDPFANRTWGWYLHQFHFLLPLLAHAVCSTDERAVVLALALVRAWSDRYLEVRGHGSAWHDHASALRARHVLLLRQYLLDRAPDQDDDLHFVERFLRAHIDVLTQDGFYSRSTNHGLDQSLALLELTMELDGENASSEVTQMAVERIRHEVGHAFASDGGHVENSTAYLNYGVKQALEAEGTGRLYLGDAARIGLDESLLDRAIRALAYSVRPDRTLPLIGDTTHFQVRDFPEVARVPAYPLLRFAATAGAAGEPFTQQSLVLPESGWAMVRAGADAAKTYIDSLHLVFKCGFKSTYHRHDDDLSFVLYAFREDWLIDGGLYKHAPSDPLRIYARSSSAHNLSEPLRARATRDLSQVTPEWGIHRYSDDGREFRLSAGSGMFRGYASGREIRFDRERLNIQLRDTVRCIGDAARLRLAERVAAGGATHLTRFITPHNKQVRVDRANACVHVLGKRHMMSIRALDPDTKIVVVAAREEPSPYALTSIRSGVMLPAKVIEFHHSTVDLNAGFELQLGPRPPREAPP